MQLGVPLPAARGSPASLPYNGGASTNRLEWFGGSRSSSASGDSEVSLPS